MECVLRVYSSLCGLVFYSARKVKDEEKTMLVFLEQVVVILVGRFVSI